MNVFKKYLKLCTIITALFSGYALFATNGSFADETRKSTRWSFDPRNLGKWFNKNTAIRMAKENANGPLDSKQQATFENLLRGLNTKQKEEVAQAFIKELEINHPKDFDSRIAIFRKNVETTLKPNEIMVTLVDKKDRSFQSYEIINLHEIDFAKPLSIDEIKKLFDTKTLSTHTSNTGKLGRIRSSALMNILAKGIANKLKFNDQESVENQLNRQIGIITDTPWTGIDSSFRKAILARLKTDIIKQDTQEQNTQENNTDDAMPVQQELQAIEAEQKIIAQTADSAVTHEIAPQPAEEQNHQPLTPSQVRKLNPTELESLNSSEIIEMLPNFTAHQVAALTPQQFEDLPEGALKNITSEQLDQIDFNKLTAEQLITILPEIKDGPNISFHEPEKIQTLNPDQIAKVMPTLDTFQQSVLIQNLNIEQLEAVLPELSPKRIGDVAPETIKDFTSDQIKQLNKEQTQSLKRSQLKALMPTQILGLNFSYLTKTQKDWIDKDAAVALMHDDEARDLIYDKTSEPTVTHEIAPQPTEEQKNDLPSQAKNPNQEDELDIARRIQNLTPEEVLKKLLTFNRTEIAYLTKEQLQDIPVDKLMKLHDNQLDALVLNRLTTRQLIAILPKYQYKEAQLNRSYTKEQIQSIPLAEFEDLLSKLDQGQITRLIIDLSDAQLASILKTLTPRQITFMTSQQIESLTTDQFNDLSLKQAHQFNRAQLKAFTDTQINNFNLEKFNDSQLNTLHQNNKTLEFNTKLKIIDFIESRHKKMAEAITELTPAKIKALDKQTIQALIPAELVAFNKDQIQHFSLQQLDYLSENQFQYIPVEYFPDARIQPLLPKLSGSQISNLSTDQIQKIPASILANTRYLSFIDSDKFNSDQIKDLFFKLTDKQINTLPLEELHKIPAENLARHPQFQWIDARRFSKEQVQALLPQNKRDSNKLTRHQIILILSDKDDNTINPEEREELIQMFNITDYDISSNKKKS